MSPPGFVAVILAAGEGSRLKSERPKVLHEIAGQSLIRHVVAALRPLDPAATVVVIGRDMDAVAREVAPLPTAIQFPPRGTGDAVRMAHPVHADWIARQTIVTTSAPENGAQRRSRQTLHSRVVRSASVPSRSRINKQGLH